MILLYTVSFSVLYIEFEDIKYLYFYFISLAVIELTIVITRVLYKRANKLITNNMCMLLSVGFIILSRISFDNALRQMYIATFSIIVTSFIPYIISKGPFFSRLKWSYALTGIGMLLLVYIFSIATNGAKISITLFDITFQPSEFVKILFVFFVASFLEKSKTINNIILTSALAALHILILVASKDLGGAVILFAVYLSMIYVATCNLLYLSAGFVLGTIASIIGYKIFYHVRVRVNAFINPFDSIENAGYQIAQSLFAICTGGMFGMGLTQGMPKTIPVVKSDFIFSAICEEFGVFFGINIILICLSCFVLFMNIAIKFDNLFYKYVATGLGVLYAFQVLLTIGGVTKFMPLTGVTLPLISYGGTSVFVTIIMFSIIQGMYIGRNK